jgi:hypothetical protein
MHSLGQDLRVTFRNLGRNRSFTLAAILTLALRIGANSVAFTVIRAVLLKPLAYREPGRLVEISAGANFLEILGVQPLLGRGFLPEEESAGGPKAAMISAPIWQTCFQGDPHIAGKTAAIGAAVYTIVGVLPSGLPRWISS